MDSISWYACPTRLFIGPGAHREAASLLNEWGTERLLAVIDPAVLETAFARTVVSTLQGATQQIRIVSDIRPEPDVNCVNKAFSALTDFRADVVLAIGGGSAIDVPKALAILATNGGRIEDYEGTDKFASRPLPRIAIPTTAGTGSEVSGSCVITDRYGSRKMSIRHAKLNPCDAAVLDPLGLVTLPAEVAVHSGMDAFVHALEGYVSKLANPITDALNLHALELIAAHLRAFVARRDDIDSGTAMLCAATLAGMAFGITGLGNVHCMARFVGARFHVSHGLANAICLPPAARFNASARLEKFARLASVLDRNVIGLSVEEAAEEAVLAINQLCQDLGVVACLRDFGACAEDLPELAKQCAEAGYNRWNPRNTDYHDFLRLFQEVF